MGVRKIHNIRLVKIQHEERLAATSELNHAPSLVTGGCEDRGMGYCAATQVKVPAGIHLVSDADVVHSTEGSTLITVNLSLRSWNIAESSGYTSCTHVEDVLLKSRMRENLTSGSVRAHNLGAITPVGGAL